MIILGIVLIGILLYVWSLYNRLVGMRERTEEAWSQIDVQLKRRTDLVPNLVETVKGYAKHEKEVFSDVTKARSALMHADTPHDKAEANNMFTQALGKLFAVAEAYPELKANENFLQLQKELSDTEDKIGYARQYYNTAIVEYNTLVQTFPAVVIAKQFGFNQRDFFQMEEGEKAKPEVKF